MLIAGAGGFARQILTTLKATRLTEQSVFYHDHPSDPIGFIPEYFKILRKEEEAREYLKQNPDFILAIGNPASRAYLMHKLENLGGVVYTLIDPSAGISEYETQIGNGCTILQGVIIESGVKLGKGALINVRAIITHDCSVGDFSEISPAAVLLGSCKIGNNCFIGAGAIILPGIQIGDGAIIGAGAVVSKDVPENTTVVGVPAKSIQKN